METMFLLSALIATAYTEDFCSINNFEFTKGSKSLQFSKELSQQEYTSVDSFKSLHCCATAFRSIEWYKDDRPYPWPHNVSSLIINPASHNQTIYTQRVGEMDRGRYHCLVTNATHVIRHDVHLNVGVALGAVGPPKPTYIPKDQYLRGGDHARLYCEAYVGTINLPDAKNEIIWTKVKENDSLSTIDARIQQRSVYRQNNQVLGCFLTIMDIKPQDFGQYLCLVSNTNDQTLEMSVFLHEASSIPQEKWKVYFLIIAATAVPLILLIAFCIFRKKCLTMCRKLQFCLLGNPHLDIIVLYTDKDAVFVRSIVTPALSKFDYSFACHVVHGGFLSVDSKYYDLKAKRLIAVFSNSAIEDWTCKNLNQIVCSLLKLHSKLICIFLQKLPEIDSRTEDGRRLSDNLKKIHYVTEAEIQGNTFLTIVRMGLPLKTREISKGSLQQLM